MLGATFDFQKNQKIKKHKDIMLTKRRVMTKAVMKRRGVKVSTDSRERLRAGEDLSLKLV